MLPHWVSEFEVENHMLILPEHLLEGFDGDVTDTYSPKSLKASASRLGKNRANVLSCSSHGASGSYQPSPFRANSVRFR